MSYDATVGRYQAGSRYTSYTVAPYDVHKQLPKQPSSTASSVNNSHSRSEGIMPRHSDLYSVGTLPVSPQNDLALPPYSLVDQSAPHLAGLSLSASGHPVSPITRGTSRDISTQLPSYRTGDHVDTSQYMSTRRAASIAPSRESPPSRGSVDSASLPRQYRESQVDGRPAQSAPPNTFRPHVQARRSRLPSCPSVTPRNDLLEQRIGTSPRRFSHGDQSNPSLSSIFPGGPASTRARIKAFERHLATTSLGPADRFDRRDTRFEASEFGSSAEVSLASSSAHRVRISDNARIEPSHPFTPRGSRVDASNIQPVVTQVASTSTSQFNKPLPVRPDGNNSEHSASCSICTSTLPTYDESQLLLLGTQQRCPCRLLELFPPDEQLEILDELTNEISAIALQIQEYRSILRILNPARDRDAFDAIVQSIEELKWRRDSDEKYVKAFQGLMRVLLER